MRILVVHPFGIGDLLFSYPLLEALAEDPKVRLGFICNRRTEELIRHHPLIRWYRVFEKDEFRALWASSKRKAIGSLARLIAEVRSEKFDLLIDLSLGWQIGLAGVLSGIPERIGFNFRARGRFLTKKLTIRGFDSQPVAGYNLELLTLLGRDKPALAKAVLRLPEERLSQARALLASSGIPDGVPLIGLVPGGGASWGPNASFKQWPAHHFSALADRLAARTGSFILLFGDAKERVLCEEVKRGMEKPALVLAPVSSLLLLAALFSKCALVVGNDSGPMHLAAAVGTKTVSLFGPVDPLVYGPFGQGARALHRVAVKDLDCRPCYRQFRFPPCPWDNACLQELEVKKVLDLAEELLG